MFLRTRLNVTFIHTLRVLFTTFQQWLHFYLPIPAAEKPVEDGTILNRCEYYVNTFAVTLRVLRFSQRWLWKVGFSSMCRHVVCQNISTFGGKVLPPSSELSTPWRWKVYLPPARQWIATRHGVTSLKCSRCFILLLHPSVLQETEMLRKTWIKRGRRKKGELAFVLS